MAKQTFIGNLRQAPVWLKDFGSRDHLLPVPAKVDPTSFTDAGGVTVTASAATQNATSVTVTALTPNSVLSNTTLIAAGNVIIPSGTTLYFGGQKVATLTADAKIGDTTLTVAALPTALTGGEVATYSMFGTELVPAGTMVSRTYSQRDAFTPYHAAIATDDEFFLTFIDNIDVRTNADVELVRHGSVIAENYLPNYTAMSTGANEVQTVAVDTIMSGGKIGITATDKNGVPQGVLVAYNTSWTQTVADIQTALIAVLGTAAVAAAVTATHDMTLTFSGTGYAGVAQPPVGVDISAATGPTKVTVTRSTPGGTSLLTKLRSVYRCIVGAQ